MSHVRGSAKPAKSDNTDRVATGMSAASNGSDFESGRIEQVALDDLLEVEACLREMLQSTTDPCILQRLFNLHREIQCYVAEVNAKNSPK